MSLNQRILDACYAFHDHYQSPGGGPAVPNRIVIRTGSPTRSQQIAWAEYHDFEWRDVADLTGDQTTIHSFVDDAEGSEYYSLQRSEAFDDTPD